MELLNIGGKEVSKMVKVMTVRGGGGSISLCGVRIAMLHLATHDLLICDTLIPSACLPES